MTVRSQTLFLDQGNLLNDNVKNTFKAYRSKQHLHLEHTKVHRSRLIMSRAKLFLISETF